MASMWWAQDNAPETAKTNSELEDLFVFGYACKVFRDDEKASYIDQGKQLIPWMGDDRLMIDRSVALPVEYSKKFRIFVFTNRAGPNSRLICRNNGLVAKW